jgi:GDPmannose 4,6-dehydratase
LEVCDISCPASVTECIKQTLKQHSRLDETYLLAAMSHVGDSFNLKDQIININGQSAYYFLEALRQYSPGTRLYFAGTSELIGGNELQTAFNEVTPWHPRSPYAIGKALGCRWVDFYKEAYGMFVCYGIICNHSNTYRSLDFVIRKITNTAARIALGKEKELKLGHLDWSRDESWSDFCVEAMWKMLQLNKPENFVIGNGVSHLGQEYLFQAFHHFNLNWQDYVVFDDKLKRPNEVHYLLADSQKAQQMLGWRPERISFAAHIALMCDYDYQLEVFGGNPIRPDVFGRDN